MIRYVLPTALLCLSTVTAAAQEVQVRSGEHGDFTRVALDLPEQLEWRIDQTSAETVDIRFGDDSVQFDLSRAMNRLNRGRVAGISELPGGKGIRISLGCVCVPDAFQAGSRMLVVDLRAGTPPAVSSARREVPVPPAASFLSSVRLGQNPGIGPDGNANTLLPEFTAQPRPLNTTDAAPEQTPVREADGLDPGVFEHLLAEQLATAATDGLLDSAMRPLPEPNATPAAEPATTMPSTTEHSAEDAAAKSLEAAISGRTPGDMQSRIRIGGATCVPDAQIDVASWGGPDPLSDTIPGLRARLFGEFDRLDHDAMTDLARAYISIGFGAEARALLDLDPESHKPELFALAGIVAGEPDGAGVFAGQPECDGAAAFWALLGSSDLPGNAGVNQSAALATFEGLPIRLRTLLGPRLATRLAEEGLPNAARNVLSRLKRATGGINEEMLFSEAQIERSEGAHDEAHQILNAIAAKPGPNAPEAVAQAIELATENGERVNDDLAALSGAYSTELRDTEQGPDLWLAHLRALAANGEFDASFEQLFDKPNYPEPVRARATTDLLTLLAEQAQDTSFLKHALARTDDYDGLASRTSAVLVAQRLVNLGLPAPARTWLGFEGIDRSQPEVRLLYAKAHLAQAEPEQAEIALIGLQGDEVLALRAEARRMMGDYSYAAEAYTTLGNIEGARQSAWLAGESAPAAEGALSTDAEGNTQDPLNAAMQLMQESLPDPVASAPSLAIAETVAGSGAETRQALRALLDATRLSE